MAWATPDNIKNLWHDSKSLPTDEKLTSFIRTVESQVRNEYGTSVQSWIDSAELDSEFIADTVAWIVIDYLKTDGKPYASISQSYAGAGSMSVTNTTTARTSLRLTGSDLAMFRPKTKKIQGSFFSASMAPQATRFPSVSSYYGDNWRYESAPGNNDGGV